LPLLGLLHPRLLQRLVDLLEPHFGGRYLARARGGFVTHRLQGLLVGNCIVPTSSRPQLFDLLQQLAAALLQSGALLGSVTEALEGALEGVDVAVSRWRRVVHTAADRAG